MTDYIEREAAINAVLGITTCVDRHAKYNHMAHQFANAVLFNLNKLPAAEVKPVRRGKWCWDNFKYNWTCYACGWTVDYINPENPWGEPKYAFCPCCGADMWEENE